MAMRKLMIVVLMELIMLNLCEVQANDIMSSSLPMGFPHPSQLDGFRSLLHDCLDKDIEECKKKKRKPGWKFIDYENCIIKSFYRCIWVNDNRIKSSDIELYEIVKECLDKYDKFGLHKSGTKLLKCYKVELKKLK